MTPSIDKLESELTQGKVSMSDLLFFRMELHRPFTLHPLGFLSCTLMTEMDRKVRLHIWPAKGGTPQSSGCQIHDHVFQFRSWVMAGSIENIEYAVSAEGQDFAAYRTKYIDACSTLIKSGKIIRISELRRHTFGIGSSYAVQAGTLHKTERVGADTAFTVLITTDLSTDSPLVLGPTAGLEQYIYKRESLDESVIEPILAELLPSFPSISLSK